MGQNSTNNDDRTELRVQALLAWNNWPDNEESRRVIAENHKRDPYSAAAWDRVIEAVVARAEIARLREDYDRVWNEAQQAGVEVTRLRAVLIQIREVCCDNAAASCNQAMVLQFVDSVAREALGK